MFPLYATAISFKLISQTQPVHVKTAQELLSRMDGERSKVLIAHQGKFRSQWLNVVPCKNPGLGLDDQQLWISIGLRLGANISVANMRHCGKGVERDGLHGLSCTKSAGRFSHEADSGISRLAFNARTAWTAQNWSLFLIFSTSPVGILMLKIVSHFSTF